MKCSFRAGLVAAQPAVFAQNHLCSGRVVHVACKQHLTSTTETPVAGDVDVDGRRRLLQDEPRPIRIVLRSQFDCCFVETRRVGVRIQGDGPTAGVAQRDASAASYFGHIATSCPPVLQSIRIVMR